MKTLQPFHSALIRLFLIHAPEHSQIHHLVTYFLLRIKSPFLRQISNLACRRTKYFSIKHNLTGIRMEYIHDNPDRRRLTCTISTKQPERPSALHREADPMQDFFFPEAFSYIF